MKIMKHRTLMKKAISFLTVICWLAGSLVPLHASASGAEEEIPRIVFTNEPKESEDLYVTKTLVSAVEGEEIPETARNVEFWFKLELNGSPVKNTTYHVEEKNSDGKYVDVCNPSSSALAGHDRKTDAAGRFCLRAGQRAVFRSEDVRALRVGAAFRVTEEAKEGYQQTTPEGGAPAAGTVTEYGGTAAFVNEYVPSGTGDKATLEVRKTVSSALGYPLPDNPDFTFSLRLNGQARGNEPYEVYDLYTGGKDGEGATTEEGLFTLKGGQKAVFTGPGILTGLDYEVRELDLPEGWKATGETNVSGGTGAFGTHTTAAVQTGETRANTILYFNNAFASFAVSKEVEDGEDSEQGRNFTFELTHGDRSFWTGAKYYVYDIRTKQLIGDTYRTTGTEEPDQGRFTLESGQIALFFGIPAGEKYNVREVQSEVEVPGETQYRQSYPMDAEQHPVGYTDKTVQDNAEQLEFRNKPVNGLTVSKAVVNESGEAAFDTHTEFTFFLYKVDEAGIRTPQSKAYYLVGESNHETGEDGKFTLRADETANFTALRPGQYLVVEDASNTPEYSVVPKDDREGNAKKTAEQSGTLVQGGNLNFTFTNYYVPNKLDLVLTKTDGDGVVLEGAEFMLYWDEAETNPVEPESSGGNETASGSDHPMDGLKTADSGDAFSADGAAPLPGGSEDTGGRRVEKGPFATSADGTLTFENLKAGVYYLREVKAPSGYVLLPEAVKIEVKWEEDGIHMNVDNGAYDKAMYSVDNEKGQIRLTVINRDLYELPNSGGMGIYWYLIGGTLLMMAAALISYKNKRTGEVRNN